VTPLSPPAGRNGARSLSRHPWIALIAAPKRRGAISDDLGMTTKPVGSKCWTRRSAVIAAMYPLRTSTHGLRRYHRGDERSLLNEAFAGRRKGEKEDGLALRHT
jgi:hypothetical protein